LAAVTSPLKGDPVAGTALRAGHFLSYGVKVPIAQVDFSPAATLAPAFERTVHGFTWMRDLEACAPPQQCIQTAARALATSPEARGAPAQGVGWKVGGAGPRQLSWLGHGPRMLAGSDEAVRGRVLAAMEGTARWLDRNHGKAEDTADALVGWGATVEDGLL